MRRRTVAPLAATLLAASAALMGCGTRVAERPAPPASAATRLTPASVSPPVSAPVSPLSPPSASPSPSPAGPGTPSPEPSAFAGAARKVAAAAAVQAALPRFDEAAADMFARSGVPGATVAVIAGDRAVYVRCFGVREAGRPEPVDKDTVFPLAALSKGFTATMLASLVEDGEIAWDDPVRKHWPGFRLWDPWVSRHVSYRDLMTQRSGLPAFAGDELQEFGYGRMRILHRLRHLRPVAGFRTAYADQHALVTVAAVAASRATDHSWAQLMRHRVLEPLGMDSTVLDDQAYLASPDRASLHALVDGTMRTGALTDNDAFAPAGGVSSSISDLVTYVRLHLGGAVPGAERVADAAELDATHAATTVTGQTDEGPAAYALGWETLGFRGRRIVRHAGVLREGAGALIALVPEDGVGVVVLTNSFPEGHTLTFALANTIFDLYMGLGGVPPTDWLARQRAESARDPNAEHGNAFRTLPEEPPAEAAAPRNRSAYVGTYANDYYGRVTVRPGRGASLVVRLGHGRVLTYLPWDGDTWRDAETHAPATFAVRHGRATSVRLAILSFGGRDGRFSRRR